MARLYSYEEVKSKLQEQQQKMRQQLQKKRLTAKDRQTLQQSIDNYQYILELVEMNYFHRGIRRRVQKKQ